MEIIGFIAAIGIGLILGLIGAGGSILTVPVMVYLFRIEPYLATTYSLFIVGISSLIGMVPYGKNKLVDYKTSFFFGIPSILGVFIMRHYIHPMLPNEIISTPDMIWTKDLLVMLLFALLMLKASFNMIFKKESSTIAQKSKSSILKIGIQGLMIGLLVGLVGAGGGFLIIPALVIFNKMPIKTAIGSSLFIIAFNSLFGFLSSKNVLAIHWPLLLEITGIAIIGMLLGTWLSQRIDGSKLKPFFGYFVLLMGILIMMNELL
ncbi:TSUP family transporter [Sphingobacterium sp. DK4209]|uniref:Probable membrane transporter protein n=1 Tax=Sphingobacterium zhuxiongii TaxID=2662364 RepID=A0A5Q0QGP0_9SPHI|nr:MULTISPECIES: sulfite exporter TauE/SafE family protein [unclassified Sphingobacterium]MVZ64790.1 TSUP family transporter [Sphingobacterium sp. DK4209]QGA27118.1 TSUP family transporter [Sphingobacterium sp. dk4302]